MAPLLPAVALFAALYLSPSPTAADVRFARLAQPGIVAIVRHAQAPGTGDPARFTLDDCATQRNLDARGREQARAIGAAIRAAGVVVDRVLTSQWCRCRDTARLLDLGPVEDLSALNSFFRNPPRAEPQTAELRQFLVDLPAGETVVLVTHYVNIRALTGRNAASGEVLLLEIGRDDTVSVVDEILISPDPALGAEIGPMRSDELQPQAGQALSDPCAGPFGTCWRTRALTGSAQRRESFATMWGRAS